MRYEYSASIQVHPPTADPRPLLDVPGLTQWHLVSTSGASDSQSHGDEKLTVHWRVLDDRKLDSATIRITPETGRVWEHELSSKELTATGSVTSPKYYGPKHDPVRIIVEVKAPTTQPLTAAQAAYTTLTSPQDVCISFPPSGRHLFAHSAVLSAASSYFSTLLTSDFAEGDRGTVHSDTSMQLHGRSSAGGPPQKKRRVDVELGFGDSDEEAAKDDSPKPALRLTDPMHTIQVTGTCYSTYSALLMWIHTRHITFAPLLSTFRASATHDTSPAELRSRAIAKDFPFAIPPPVSPKSIYRAAHLFELPALRSHALSAFENQLTPQNVAYELYGDVAACYDEVKEVCLSYAVKNWKEVQKSEGLKWAEAVDASELPSGAVGIGLEIARRLSLN
ncbi:hypothetical protein BCR35DRAFT_348907 [Leucosporidium creatinivorum]|uniref:BTB domain-containing protein n=1 Tax=Leucosporidium creatinivorum TaxID=106004 RepID=A0A1Y2G4S0_9BASI|nr:hypothetical protein BCR35DRAFT_348907 [Leucosporidium creatinivorum]